MNELEERWRDLGEFIREQRRVGHLSLRKLSEMAGISNPYLSQIERGLRKPSAEILQQGETDLVDEIRRDPWLSEEQKKTLVQIYETFRAERRAAGFGPVEEPADPEVDDDPDEDGPEHQESGALAGRS